MKAAFGTAGAQVINMGIGLVSVPIGLHYFGAIRYGIWLLNVSLMVYLSATQFGIGQAAAAYVAKASDAASRKAVVRRSFHLLALISAGLSLLLLLAVKWPTAWLPLFGVLPPAVIHETIWATLITLALFLVRSPGCVFAAAFIGAQDVQWERFYVIILPAILSFGALLATIKMQGSLIQLALLTGAGQCLTVFLNYVHLRLAWQRGQEPIGLAESKQASVSYNSLLRSGRTYFVAGIAGLIVWNTDNLVISHFLGPAHVTAYSVNFRLYSAAISCFVIVNSAVWPMYGRAAGQGDWSWISRTYRLMTSVLPILGGMVCIGAIAFAQDIIGVWVGPAGNAGQLTVLSLGVYGYLLSLANCHVTVQGSLNLMRRAAWIGLTEAMLNLGLSILLVRPLGVGGVALGSALATLLTSFWMLPRDLTRQTGGKVDMSWGPVIRHALGVLLPTAGLVWWVNGALSGWVAFTMKVMLFMVYIAGSVWLLPISQRTRLLAPLVAMKNSRPA